jgi:cell division protein FtsW
MRKIFEKITSDDLSVQDSTLSLELFIQILLFLLGLWGCMAIYSANFFNAHPFFFAGRQLLWLIIGMVIMLFTSRVPFAFFRDNAWKLAVIAYIPLIAVLIWGVKINGMTGWFAVGNSLIQPSELAKAFYILLLCQIGVTAKENSLRRFFLMLLVAVFWMLPIALQPDFGTAIVYGMGFVIVYWALGGRLWHLLMLPVLGLPFMIYFCVRNPYLVKRITGFLDPGADPLGSGWHVRQFQLTLARGGLYGTGTGKAYWANSYLPFSHSDSVFASMSEALGFVGTAPVLIMVLLLIFLVFMLAFRVKTNMQKVFILSTAMFFAFQFLLHVSVNVTLLPPTGVTLPILSYGGSSMVATMFAFGVLLSATTEKNSL